MADHKDLVFFNKEGDFLNFNYNEDLDRFEGDILFHENSDDTYRTYGVYMLEKVPSFEYEVPGILSTKRWQLFNEYNMNLYGSKYQNEQIDRVEPVNNDPTFYSKWIYGEEFNRKFPIGSLIAFDNPFTEFTNDEKYYTVVDIKKNAIMIISDIDNDTFETNFKYIYDDDTQYGNITLSGKNAIGVYQYVDNNLNDNLSIWNENQFYQYYYEGRRLNIVNSKNNNKTVTVKNGNILDIKTFEYHLSKNDLPNATDLIIEVKTKTDLPNIYNSYINIDNDHIININPGSYPELLKPGKEFKIVGSTNNTNFFTVSPIPDWHGIANKTDFNVNDQVIFENKIYQCILNYTQDFSNITTSLSNPSNDNIHWSNPTYVRVDQNTTAENLLLANIYLTTNRFYYQYSHKDIDDESISYSPEVILASIADKYRGDFKTLKITSIYENDTLILRSEIPSKYVEVTFYYNDIDDNNIIGNDVSYVENLVEVKEELNYELNRDLAENHEFNIVFTDIDEYGIKIHINGMEYNEEFSRVFVGGVLNLERSIDRTLRKWFSRYYITLYRLGIIASLKFTGASSSIYYNTIKLKTEYPNVPLDIEKIEVGITADFHIEHSDILFTEIGPYFNLIFNDIEYGVETIYLSGNIPNINATIQKWIDEYQDKLKLFGIIVKNINNLIKIGYNKLDGRRLEYIVKTNTRMIPGIEGYKITRRQFGNHGLLIASNEVVLPGIGVSTNIVPNTTYSTTYSIPKDFMQEDFSTGMVFALNNTSWPWVNQEFNIEYLDEGSLNLSYEGPFWGELDGSLCDSSAFAIIAFDNGFSATGCVEVPIGSGGEFDLAEFDDGFTIEFNPNSYIQNNYNLNQYQGTNNLVDLIYLELTESLYAFGDELIIFDAYLGQYTNQIDYSIGNPYSNPIEMKFNEYNNYIYLLTEDYLYYVDVLNNTSNSIQLQNKASHFDINKTNGYIYVTRANDGIIEVYNNHNNHNSDILDFQTLSNGGKLLNIGNYVYALLEDHIIKLSGTTIDESMNISGLNLDFIIHNPNSNKLMIADGSNIYQLNLNDLSIYESSPISGNAIDGIFNNFSYEMNVSLDTPELLFINDLNNYTSYPTSYYGEYVINQFDGDLYMASQNGSNLVVYDSLTGNSIHVESLSNPTKSIVFNPLRNSVWGVQPTSNSLVEIEVILGVSVTNGTSLKSVVEDGMYGTLDPLYTPPENIWIKTKEFVRTPRENLLGDKRVEYYWKWETDDKPEFFLYDFLGDQLDKDSAYAFKGNKPLKNIVLNKKPNRDINSVEIDQRQQTIFDRIDYDLMFLDEINDKMQNITPYQLFIGYKSEIEGPQKSVLQLFKKEDIFLSFKPYDDDDLLSIYDDELDNNQIILKLDDNNGRFFTDLNTFDKKSDPKHKLKADQVIEITLKDVTNDENQYISYNNGLRLKILNVYSKYIVAEKIDNVEIENNIIVDYPTNGYITHLEFGIRVIDKELGRFTVYGQTEQEDERFKIELGNVGKLIDPDDVFIFSEYDIMEGGIDWTILNRKRKEMLMMKHLIYPYIGAYKSIINAINYFGYNDLQLNEYYRNVKSDSPLFGQLYKVEIPKIFDKNVEGWVENDFIKHTYPNKYYDATNLFNLTYFITDKDGNNVLHYSLDEIIIKLQGLKYWLKRNIIPLTHKIHDITGVSYLNHSNGILHKLHDIQIFNIYENMTPITGKMNEAYISPINSGSSVYTCVIDFYTIMKGVGHEEYLKEKPNPFNGMTINLPDYYTIKVRTYQTYNEWEPFKIYNKGDKVKYYDKLYESTINGNRIKNPRKYENVLKWSSSNSYQELDKVEYFGEYYTYTELGDIKNLSWEDGGLTFSSGTHSSYEDAKYNNIDTLRTKSPINGTNKKINITFNSDDYEISLYHFDRKPSGEYINLNNTQDYFDDFDVEFKYAGFEIKRRDGATMSLEFLEDIKFNIDYFYKNPQPTLDTQNWLNVTEWKEIPYKPTQVINEFRRSDNLTPFNFTLDSNIDPFVNIVITSDNNYGEIYSDVKNYEIRGNDDTFTEIANLPITSNPLVNIPWENKDEPNGENPDCIYIQSDETYTIDFEELIKESFGENTGYNLDDRTDPLYGTIDENNIYTPKQDNTITNDYFHFRVVNDDEEKSDYIKVCIIIEFIEPPVGEDPNCIVTQNGKDYNIDFNALIIESFGENTGYQLNTVTQPIHGSISDGIYTPPQDQTITTDSFSFNIIDGNNQVSNNINVCIIIECNDFLETLFEKSFNEIDNDNSFSDNLIRNLGIASDTINDIDIDEDSYCCPSCEIGNDIT